MAETFDFDAVRAARVLALMQRAPDGPVTMAGEDWAQAAMSALVQAELLAASAGVVPWFTFEDGTRGVLAIGAARERIDEAPEDVRTIYLATHGAVRATHASAERATGAAPALAELGELGEDLQGPALLIALTVVAIAAIIGTAWYCTARADIEVSGRNVRTTAVAAEAARLALEQLHTTGKIDPGVWEVLRTQAEMENHSPWVPVAVAGVVVVGVGGLAVLHHWRTQQRKAAS